MAFEAVVAALSLGGVVDIGWALASHSTTLPAAVSGGSEEVTSHAHVMTGDIQPSSVDRLLHLIFHLCRMHQMQFAAEPRHLFFRKGSVHAFVWHDFFLLFSAPPRPPGTETGPAAPSVNSAFFHNIMPHSELASLRALLRFAHERRLSSAVSSSS